jgi:hypothetical protein
MPPGRLPMTSRRAGFPSLRAIRAQLHVGQPRAQRVHAHLATLAGG